MLRPIVELAFIVFASQIIVRKAGVVENDISQFSGQREERRLRLQGALCQVLVCELCLDAHGSSGFLLDVLD